MRRNDIEMTILVRGKPITEYPLQDQTFVEGRAGSEYEIDVRNHTSHRVETVVSVDGLSVLDGKPAGAESRGYMIPAYSNICIPGWTLDQAQVAKFAFAGKQTSYATQMTGDARNNGVIGLMAYREYEVPRYDYTRMRGIQCSAGGVQGMSSNGSLGITPSGLGPMYRGIAPTTNITSNYSASASASPTSDSMSMNNMSVNNLGTGFGQATAFATRQVTFQRAGVICTMVIGYDEKKGLKARGIEFTRKPKPVPQPQAFPGLVGCAPPPGWTG